MKVINRYESESGAKMNLKKSSIIFMKSWDLGQHSDLEVRSKDRYLGLKIKSRKEKDNNQAVITRFKVTCQSWVSKRWNILLKARLV
jgi:hypothetical protein